MTQSISRLGPVTSKSLYWKSHCDIKTAECYQREEKRINVSYCSPQNKELDNKDIFQDCNASNFGKGPIKILCFAGLYHIKSNFFYV